MNTTDYNIVRTLVNQFYELVECEAHEIYEGDITSHDMDRYTEQIVAICNTIATIYCNDMVEVHKRMKGGSADV